MKLTLQGHEVGDAVKQYLRDTYSLYGEVEVEELPNVEVDIKPRKYNTPTSYLARNPETVSEPTVDTEREAAITRADHLGIKYRADISTEKLIERIEEHEENISLIAQESEGLIKHMEDGNELPLENDVDTIVESDKPLEEVSDETIQEAQEDQPQKKKKSIFDKSE